MSNQKAENELYKPEAVACFFGSSNCWPVASPRYLPALVLGQPCGRPGQNICTAETRALFFPPPACLYQSSLPCFLPATVFPQSSLLRFTLFRRVSSLILLAEELCRCNWLWRGNVQPGMESIKPLRQAAAQYEATAIGDAMN